MHEQRTVSRRRALTALGLTGVATAAAAPSAARADTPAPDPRDVRTLTLAELRATTDPEPDVLYYVMDAGQEGPFRFDPDDTTSTDNTGLTVVGADGARFARIVDGPIRISWFGAKADYNSVTKTGTPNDDAFAAALAALKPFARRTKANGGFEVGIPPIVFDSGNYLFTRKQFAPTWYSAIKGLTIRGQGMYATNVYFDCPEADNGSDNYFLYNHNRLFGLHIEDISFFGVSGTEKFLYVYSTGTAGKTLFRSCAWHNWAIGVDTVEARANADLNKFEYCRTRDMAAESIFFNWNNPQSVINSFIDCDFHSHGTIYNFTAGGILTVVGGSYITFADGCVLNIDDPAGAGVGVGNGEFLFDAMKPEVRDASRLVHLNAPEAHVAFNDCQLTVGQSNFASTWAAGKSYDAHARARVSGASNPSMGRAFVCVQAHTSSADTKPLSGADWASYWKPLYEIELESGAVRISGGTFAYISKLQYGDNSYVGAESRPLLTLADGCYLVNPLADAVDFAPTEETTNTASRPRAVADGCRPYTGAYPNAYWVTPTDPVDVTLNARHGYDGGAVARHTFIFTATPAAGGGLPAHDDGELTFLLPRGANVTGMQVVAGDSVDPRAYTVTNYDGSVTFLPNRPDLTGRHTWYPIDTEPERTFRVTSKARERATGLICVEYI